MLFLLYYLLLYSHSIFLHHAVKGTGAQVLSSLNKRKHHRIFFHNTSASCFGSDTLGDL